MSGTFLRDPELERFMAAVRERKHKHQPRDHALFALLATTGLRPIEALALTRSDLHLKGNDPWIRVERRKKKRRTWDELQIPKALAVTLSHYVQTVAEDGPVFVMARRQCRRLFHYYRRAAELRRVPLYALRHTAATRFYRATRNIKLVQALLGHESADMATIYAHVTRDMMRQVADVPAVV